MVKSYNKKINKKNNKEKIIIDSFFEGNNDINYNILQDKENIYKVILNQTNLNNNNNKFYILELIFDKKLNKYKLFTRYGRVGSNGLSNTKTFDNKNDGISNFNITLKSKLAKKYVRVKVNIIHNEEKNIIKNNLKNMKKEVINLLELIFDKNNLKNDLIDLGFNSDKMPLGKLSDESFKEAFQILKQLSEDIKSNNTINLVKTLNNKFYSIIPHIMDRTNIKSNILDTCNKITQKNLMLVSLKNLKYSNIIFDKYTNYSSLYNSLKTKINLIESNTDLFKKLSKGFYGTHTKTHYFKIKLRNIYQLNKDQKNNDKVSNKILLWHGSRISNYIGILSDSLRISPPEAPITGYMFGKGVYFADLSSKSGQYSLKSLNNKIGLLLLCEWKIGNPLKKYYADYNGHNINSNYNSILGNGKTIPKDYTYINGYKYFTGNLNKNPDQGGSLLYNEYCIYDTKQINLKYLFEIEFN